MDWDGSRVLPFVLLALAPLGCGNGDDSSSAAPLALPNCSIGDAGADWPMYGQNVCNTRSGATTDPITPQTVSKLQVLWKYTGAGEISATPAVVAGQVYVPDWGGNLTRFDGATGTIVWQRNVGTILGIGDGGIAVDAGGLAIGAATRAYSVPVSRVTPIVYGNSVIFGMGSAQSYAAMAAVDKDTGALLWQTPLDMNPTALITSSPAIDGDTVFVGVSSGEEIAASIKGYPCCSFRGSVVALNAATGAIKWQTYTIEDSAYYNADHTRTGYAGVAIWSGTPTIDRNRRQVYVTTGNDYATPVPIPSTSPPGNHVDAILALDEDTGAIKWTTNEMVPKGGDVWTLSNLSGPDSDFGCGANLFQTTINGAPQDVVGAGQKSGMYWAVSADTGALLWKNKVGPSGHLGGIHWGTAVDANGVYVGVNNEFGTPYTLGGTGPQAGTATSVGSWAALDPKTGTTLWQIANPAMTAPLMGGSVNGPVTVINGVLFVGSMDAQGMMYAFNATTGAMLWSFASGGSVYGAPAISNGVLYWGAGYPSGRLGLGTTGPTDLYAFSLGK